MVKYGPRILFAAALLAAPVSASVMDEADTYCLDPRMLAAMGLDWPASGFAGLTQPQAAIPAASPWVRGATSLDRDPGAGIPGFLPPLDETPVTAAPHDPIPPIPLPGALWALLSGLAVLAGLGGLRRV